MWFSSEPTREMVFCTTAQSELQLQKRLGTIDGWQGTAARMAVDAPDRIFDDDGGFMRFWNWDASIDPEHPVVELLLQLAKSLPEDQFRLIRITAGDNELEEAGNRNLFAHLDLKVISAPRIVFEDTGY